MRLLTASLLATIVAAHGFATPEPVRAHLLTTPATSPLGNASELHVINTSNMELSFRGSLFSHRGQPLGEADTPLGDAPVAPKARLILTSEAIEGRFGSGPWTRSPMLEIRADQDAPFAAMVRMRTAAGGWSTNVNCVTEGAIHSVEGIDQIDRTHIRLINTTESRITNIRGTLRDVDGDVIGTPNQRLFASLAPKAGAWLGTSRLARAVGQQWTGQASLYLSDHPGLKLMNLNVVNNETYVNFSCFESRLAEATVPEPDATEPDATEPDMPEPEPTARYAVTFTARWTATDHGPVPGGAHFTTLAGAAVNAQADLWTPGELASSGLENLAELGQTGGFLREIAAAAAAGNASQSITSSGTGATGTSSFEVTVTRDLPNFTFASMVAPSPDWFLGLSEFSLLDNEGRWIEDTGHMGLPAWDAGTETGTEFSLNGRPTNPPEPIRLLTENVGNTVEFENGTVDGNYLATIRFQRLP